MLRRSSLRPLLRNGIDERIGTRRAVITIREGPLNTGAVLCRIRMQIIAVIAVHAVNTASAKSRPTLIEVSTIHT
jgi:hypothetical protein